MVKPYIDVSLEYLWKIVIYPGRFAEAYPMIKFETGLNT
jgi:hypothetical protein